MSQARETILETIRAANAGLSLDRLADYAAIPRKYRRAGAMTEGQRIDLLADRLGHYDSGVYRCALGDAAATVAVALRARGKTRMVLAPDFPPAWIPHGLEVLADDRVSYHDLDAADGVVTVCTVAIAFTGTIVLCHGAGEGRRASTLIPDYHLCIVRADQIVETVPEAFDRLAALGPALITTISGPSATADIEMTRVKGVHGPRTLDVILC
jgi:L-lactate dehydrogenase complex protein LldG